MTDTIVALATPTGRSAIGVVRLSGPDSHKIASSLFRKTKLLPRKAHLVRLIEPVSGHEIDQAIVTYFRAPHSFTGEDVVEIGCHGSPVVLRQVIDVCLELGARPAEPGEFTLRALSNGRMDLTEAEAVRDLIDARTVASARQAVRQLRGEFSHALQPIKDELLEVIVILESALEFVEDDLPDIQSRSVSQRLRAVKSSVQDISATYKAGHLIRDGLKMAIVGRPNVGKSSLFNALLGAERAIVTDIAGTTRDQLNECVLFGDIPVSIIDTAGLRETGDRVESIGVERSWRTMADADIVLVLVDVTDPNDAQDTAIFDAVAPIPHLIVFNKIDKLDTRALEGVITDYRSKPHTSGVGHVPISAKTGQGLDDLKSALVRSFHDNDGHADGFLVSDARHYDLLVRTAAEIGASIDSLEERVSEEIVLIGLHNALRYLGQITGETTTDDILGLIFSTFCIGK